MKKLKIKKENKRKIYRFGYRLTPLNKEIRRIELYIYKEIKGGDYILPSVDSYLRGLKMAKKLVKGVLEEK